MMLDDAYANAAYIDGADGFPPRWEKEAEAFRVSLGARAQLNVRYGPSDRQKFDFFQPEGVSRGTAVFVHGGYWKAFDKSYWSHLAAGPLVLPSARPPIRLLAHPPVQLPVCASACPSSIMLARPFVPSPTDPLERSLH